MEYKCLCCNKKYQRKFDEKLKERFSHYDNKKFIILLQKSIYPYK